MTILKSEFKYNAQVLLNKSIFYSMVDLSIEVIKTLSTLKKDDNYRYVRKCMIETVCFPEDIMNNKIQDLKLFK